MIRMLYQIMRADFLERTRRYSFLIILGITAYFGYISVPPPDANYVTLTLGNYRSLYNSAWIGNLVVMMTTTFLSLAGFYLVRNVVDRDRQTGVGQILATTRMTRVLYTVGKMLSNLAVLMAIVAVLIVMAVVMQMVRGEDHGIRIWPLLAPFILIAFPAMALVSAVAVFSETASWLQGTKGNIFYFILWWICMLVPAQINPKGTNNHFLDPMGVTVPLKSMMISCRRVFPDYQSDMNFGFIFMDQKVNRGTFHFEGVDWTGEILASRFLMLSLAFAIAGLSALPFDRFDPAQYREKRQRKKRTAPTAVVKASRPLSTPVTHLSTIIGGSLNFSFNRMLAAELRLMMKGLSLWWYAVAAGFVIAELFAPLPIAHKWILSSAWIWPLPLFSAMGTREARHNAGQLVFTAAHPLRRLLPACWLAGVFLAATTGIGVAVRLFTNGRWIALIAWAVGAAFIPSLALAFGIWSRSSKLFEVIYTLLWYAGPMSGLAALDFTGASEPAQTAGSCLIFAAATVVVLLLAFYGRSLQLRGRLSSQSS